MIGALILLFALASSGAHDFHVSRCEVVYRTSTRSLEVTQHIFVDDLERALEPVHEGVLNLCTEWEPTIADSLVGDYLLRHFTVRIGDQVQKTYFLGKEPGEDPMSMWAYIELTDVPDFSAIRIGYDVLFEVFDDQKNILSFRVDNGADQLFLLDHSKPVIEINR